jgi:uncharacterized protein (TIGR01244 family)
MQLLLPLLFVLAGAAGDVPATMDSSAMPNYSVVRPGLAAAGQPTPEALARLKAQGFKTVINLRTEQEGAEGERAAVEAAGLRYVWVPISPETFSVADVRQVQAVLDDAAAGPVLLHCASSNRVGGVLAVIEHAKGKSVDESIAEGQRAGLKSPAMVDAVRRVIKTDTH